MSAPDGTFTFEEWRRHEARAIVHKGLNTIDPKVGHDYMVLAIELAIRKAWAHGRDGKSETDLIPPI